MRGSFRSDGTRSLFRWRRSRSAFTSGENRLCGDSNRAISSMPTFSVEMLGCEAHRRIADEMARFA